MKLWKHFFPKRDDVEVLGAVRDGPYFIDSKNSPAWESVYFPSGDGRWIVLTWNYFDIEFKFETFGLSLGPDECTSATLLQVGSTPRFDRIDFYTRTEWTRPAMPGEVPSHYEQVIEDMGSSAQVPADATSAGTSLFAVVFRSIDGETDMMVTIDDDVRYSLKVVSGSAKIAEVVQSCDVFDSVGLMSWKSPI